MKKKTYCLRNKVLYEEFQQMHIRTNFQKGCHTVSWPFKQVQSSASPETSLPSSAGGRGMGLGTGPGWGI